jgi:hypothetical protein
MLNHNRRSDSLLIVAVALILAGLALAGWRMFFEAPLVWQVESVRVLAGDGPVVLGVRELGQHPGSDPGAGARQLAVESAGGRWWLANIAADITNGQPVIASSARRASRFVPRWRLVPGDRLTVGPVSIEVGAVTADTLELVVADGEGDSGKPGLRAAWRQGRLETGASSFAGCPREGSPWWRHRLDRWLGRELSLFSIGGQVDCPRRWWLAGVPYDGLRVVWVDGGFWLAPGSAGVPVTMAGSGESEARGFEQLQLPIGVGADDVQRISIGPATYRLQADGGDLILRPIDGVDVWPVDQARPPPRDPRVVVRYQLQRWVGAGDGPREWLQTHTSWFIAALLLSILAALRFLRALRRRRVCAAAALVPASLFGLVLSVGMWWLPSGLAGLDAHWLFWMGWLGWGWTSVVLLEAHRLRGLGGAVWLLALLLTGSGALVLGQLAAGGDSQHWLGLAVAHWGLWAVTGWGLGLLAPVGAATWWRLLLRLFESRTVPWRLLRLLAPLSLMVLLGIQFAAGREQGLAGVQGVEAVPLLLVFMLAFIGIHRGRGDLVLRLFAVAVLLGALAYGLWWSAWGWTSLPPLIVLGVALPWRMVAGRDGRCPLGGWLLRALLLAAVTLGLGWLVQTWLPSADIVPAWADLVSHLQGGERVRMAMDLAGRGGGWGALPDWWGWNAGVMQVAGLQGELIGAFLLNRFGAVAGLGLLAAQLGFVGLLFRLAHRLANARADTELVGLAGWGMFLVLYGLAWLFVTYWTLAWALVLGLLPFDATMTWLAADESHVALFAYPALAFALIVAWSRPGVRG